MLKFFIAIALPLFLAGCASTSANRQAGLETQALRNQLTLLEAQLKEKDTQIASLKDEIDDVRAQSMVRFTGETEKDGVISVAPKKGGRLGKPSIKQIQTALTNCGYYTGRIDGKIGKNTRKAIKEFQKANGLKTDGRVGKRTWSVLNKYLYSKDGSV